MLLVREQMMARRRRRGCENALSTGRTIRGRWAGFAGATGAHVASVDARRINRGASPAVGVVRYAGSAVAAVSVVAVAEDVSRARASTFFSIPLKALKNGCRVRNL